MIYLDLLKGPVCYQHPRLWTIWPYRFDLTAKQQLFGKGALNLDGQARGLLTHDPVSIER